jgi:hypothetical protein
MQADHNYVAYGLNCSGVRRNFRKRVRQQRISVISLHMADGYHAIGLCIPLCAICSKKYKVNILTIYFKVQISMTLCTTASGYVTLHRPFTILTVLTI